MKGHTANMRAEARETSPLGLPRHGFSFRLRRGARHHTCMPLEARDTSGCSGSGGGVNGGRESCGQTRMGLVSKDEKYGNTLLYRPWINNVAEYRGAVFQLQQHGAAMCFCRY